MAINLIYYIVHACDGDNVGKQNLAGYDVTHKRLTCRVSESPYVDVGAVLNYTAWCVSTWPSCVDGVWGETSGVIVKHLGIQLYIEKRYINASFILYAFQTTSWSIYLSQETQGTFTLAFFMFAKLFEVAKRKYLLIKKQLTQTQQQTTKFVVIYYPSNAFHTAIPCQTSNKQCKNNIISEFPA